MIKKLFSGTMSVQVPLTIFRILGLVVLVVLLFALYTHKANFDYVIRIFVPLGVLISALLASYSVLYNVENTNKNEHNKLYREKLEEISFLVKELFELVTVDNMRKGGVDHRRLVHMEILVSLYHPDLLDDFNQFSESFKNHGRSNAMTEENELHFKFGVLRNSCNTFQMKIKDELEKFI